MQITEQLAERCARALGWELKDITYAIANPSDKYYGWVKDGWIQQWLNGVPGSGPLSLDSRFWEPRLLEKVEEVTGGRFRINGPEWWARNARGWHVLTPEDDYGPHSTFLEALCAALEAKHDRS